jgi:hypothetical protein
VRRKLLVSAVEAITGFLETQPITLLFADWRNRTMLRAEWDTAASLQFGAAKLPGGGLRPPHIIVD